MLTCRSALWWKCGASAPKNRLQTNRPLGPASRSIVATALLFASFAVLAVAQTAAHFTGAHALEYARELVTFGPRYNGSEGLAKAQAWLRKQFAKDELVEDT